MESKRNLVQEMSFNFGVYTVGLSKRLKKEGVDFSLVRQLLRSSVSIGANVEEGIGAQSKRDFIHKMGIAYKEARETRYWVKLLSATNDLSNEESNYLLKEIESIINIISRILISSKRSIIPAEPHFNS